MGLTGSCISDEEIFRLLPAAAGYAQLKPSGKDRHM